MPEATLFSSCRLPAEWLQSHLSWQRCVPRVPQLLPHLMMFCLPCIADALQILVTEMGNMMAQLAAINPVVIRMLHFNPDNPNEGPSRELHESVLVSQARSHDCCSCEMHLPPPSCIS